ncbi:hexokinase HKDC1-like [Engraulis encrasicolus]|uniref:hexokinase HKDC1-like n=1 Tax=Engraulis encrasicolus TaxID=184585 RepID=UPI002FCEE5EE
MMSCAYYHNQNQNQSDCLVGMIIGTGTNACYMEEMCNVASEKGRSAEQMCINTEWGGFGCLQRVGIQTEFDKRVDDDSNNKCYHTYPHRLGETVTRLAPNCKVTFKEVDDASVTGAAMTKRSSMDQM